MKNLGKKIRDFLMEKIPAHPRDIVAVTAREFAVTRPTVHRHLGRLLRAGIVVKTGATKGAVYFLASSRDKELTFKIEPGLGEFEIWREYFRETFSGLPKNVYEICEYGFMEMLNNAIDHSAGERITISTKWQDDTLRIYIVDDGIGIFRKIADALNLNDERECILQLSKGKLTTDPDRHTGEGIFFTSRAVDKFYISSHELTYVKDNVEEDWFIERRKEITQGTGITLVINREGWRTLKGIYDRFTILDEDDIPGFVKTHILVRLSKLEEERYVSRSQAKRLLVGLDKFQHVILDFKNVETIGQAFVDEVFRVFPLRFPGIKMEFVNANEDVKFMLERGLSGSSKQIPLPYYEPEPNKR